MKLIRCLMVHGIVALTSATVYAQTPPRPTVSVRQLRDLQQGVWPADFNGDGRTDLIAGQINSGGGFGRVVVRLGAGDGTFGAVIPTSVTSGRPLGTGDFNRDSRQDAVIEEGTGNIVILPGLGDGTFGASRAVGRRSDIQFVTSSDLSGDGIRDLLIVWAGAIEVLAGRGDFTFASPVTLPPPQFGAVAGIIADYNNDGRRELAIVGAPDNSVAVYLNRGGLLFDIVHEALVGGDRSADITARDLNRDGMQDLIVAHADRSDIAYTNGAVDVLLGRGDGTFADYVRYDAGVNGPVTVVGGDFNGDGLTDVATGNISVEDGFDFKMHYWDSVSILPGSGSGTLGPAAVFRLDTDTTLRDDGEPALYSGSLHELNTSDVNGDGRTDLITSPGAVVLIRAPAPNRLPAVNAGPDVTVPWDIPDVVVEPTITELDWDWLEVEWRDKVGAVVSRVPSFRYLPPSPQGTETLTVTVTDARGGRASDSMTITYTAGADVGPDVRILRPAADENVQAGAPYRIRWYAFDNDGVAEFDIFFRSGFAGGYTPIAECTNLPGDVRECFWRNPNPVGPGAIQILATDSRGNTGEAHSQFFQIVPDASGPGGLPPGWSCGDVGAVATAGRCSHSAGVFTIEGSGADIWGTADEFGAAAYLMDGDFSLTARVTSVENVNQWTKVGIMIRAGSSAGSAHASFLVTPTTVKGTAFQRRATQGGTTVSTAGPVTTAPIWIKLVRTGNTIKAFYRKAISNAWTLVGTQTFAALPNQLAAMLVVSSHVDGTLATGVFDNVVVDQSEVWASVDIGGSASGTTLNNGATVTIEGNGAGIWGTADAFRFRYTRWIGDGTITARLRSLENTSTGAKAGVMFRESLTPGSKHVMGVVYAAGGVVLQLRGATGGTSTEAARRSGTAPEWVRLTRAGNTFTVAASNDGAAWATVGTTTVAMAQTIHVGLPVTSRVAGTLATAVFDDIWIRP